MRNDNEAQPTERQRRPTIADVATHAEVSRAAVSKVLRNAYGVSPQMRQRVTAAVDALGYRPMLSARGLRTSTRTIGVSSLSAWNPFTPMLLDGVAAESHRKGYSALTTLATMTDEPLQVEAAMSLADRSVDGLILITPTMSEENLERLASAVPIVLLGRHGDSPSHDSVASDDAAGAEEVVDHLVAAGHQRISFHTQTALAPGLPETFREQGYRQAMERHGLTADVIVGDWTYDGGQRLVDDLLARAEPPTAIHAGADIAALGALSRLWDRDLRAPEDLAIAGCDNVPSAGMAPIGLTTVDQQADELAQLATDLLIERLEGRRQARHHLVTPRLVVRRSA